MMKCPFCKKVLRDGKWRIYETIVDHGCNPNAKALPSRPTFVCSCPQSEDSFWDWYGYRYGGSYDGRTQDAIGSSAHRVSLTQDLASKIRPICSKLGAKYPYDKSYAVSRSLVNITWPIIRALRGTNYFRGAKEK